MTIDIKNIKKTVDMAKKANEERYQNHSREMLKKHVQTKFRTTMIGALARFEEYFGKLWGHGCADLTDEQKKFRQLWELARTEILNNGNNQLRAALSEIDQYTVKYNKMHYEFIIRKPGSQGV